uniref:acyl carrier protein phosphodiesterase n=1 Tax=Ornithobacterium rhinotracheale TaxID=28251 RepID=UPI0039A491F6
MNLVAHQLLSFNRPAIQVGNYLGDSVKGRHLGQFPPEVQKGILLHRHIDSFTDTHAVVKRSCARLYGEYGKYAPIVVDIFYDYFLIKNWARFSKKDFNTFRRACYKVLLAHRALYSEPLRHYTEQLAKQDWFYQYSTMEGVERTLSQLGRRTRFMNNMHMAVKALYVEEALFNEDFLAFYPELEASSREFLLALD